MRKVIASVIAGLVFVPISADLGRNETLSALARKHKTSRQTVMRLGDAEPE